MQKLATRPSLLGGAMYSALTGIRSMNSTSMSAKPPEVVNRGPCSIVDLPIEVRVEYDFSPYALRPRRYLNEC